MRNTILGIIAVIIISSAAYVFFSGQVVAPVTSPQPPSLPTKPEPNRIIVSNQEGDNNVTLQTVVLAHSGFAAIHQEVDHAPGAVVGVSALLSAGEHQSVIVAINPAVTLKGDYIAMLHTDNGDGVYQFPEADVPVKDSNGDILMAKFSIMAPSSAPAAPSAAVGAVDVSMKSGNFFFEPSQLKVKVGQSVTIHFTNSGFHTFTIDALGVNQQISGSTGSVTFTPNKKGTFEFYCAVGSHRAMGMQGTVVVE